MQAIRDKNHKVIGYFEVRGDRTFVRDPYNNLVHSFERPAVALLYIVSMLALGIHIFHGAWSLFQSLGANNPRFNRWRVYFARGFAAIIVIGNLSFPIMVQAKVLEYNQHARDVVVASKVLEGGH